MPVTELDELEWNDLWPISNSCRLEINNSTISFDISIWIQIEEQKKSEEQMVYIYHLDSVFINHTTDAHANTYIHTHVKLFLFSRSVFSVAKRNGNKTETETIAFDSQQLGKFPRIRAII